MRMLKTLLAAIALLPLPLTAHANIIYNWTGTCVTTCAGQATMLVVTTDTYMPGQPGTASELLRALYADTNVTFDFAQFFPLLGQGYVLPDMPPSTSGAFNGSISIFEDFFRSTAQGAWRIEGEGIPGGHLGCGSNEVLCTYRATGSDGVWTRLQTSVPEPSTLVLLGVGLAGLASLRRRKVG